MSDKNCEQIVRAILDRIGGPTFEQLLARIVETMIPRDGRGPPTNSDEFYFAIRDLFPQVPPENDVLGRLLCFAMRMCQLRIERTVLPRIEQNIFPLLQSVMTHIPINPPPKICSNDPN